MLRPPSRVATATSRVRDFPRRSRARLVLFLDGVVGRVMARTEAPESRPQRTSAGALARRPRPAPLARRPSPGAPRFRPAPKRSLRSGAGRSSPREQTQRPSAGAPRPAPLDFDQHQSRAFVLVLAEVSPREQIAASICRRVAGRHDHERGVCATDAGRRVVGAFPAGTRRQRREWRRQQRGRGRTSRECGVARRAAPLAVLDLGGLPVATGGERNGRGRGGGAQRPRRVRPGGSRSSCRSGAGRVRRSRPS